LDPRVILLVEDNADDVELLKRALKKNALDHQIVVASDGLDALKQLETLVPDLVLLDLHLPGLSGLEVLERLRANSRTRLLPVVVLTTSAEASDVTESYRKGANGYVRKSVDFTAFLTVTRAIDAYWLQTNLSPPHVA
jgi:two-component system response regulator